MADDMLTEAGIATILDRYGQWNLATHDERWAARRQSTADDVAIAICHGSPQRAELEAHPTLDVDGATAIAAAALRNEYGDGRFDVPISWLQVSARTS